MFNDIIEKNKKKINNIHIIGICGIGVSALALLLHNKGYKITGSDSSNNSKIFKILKSKNITIYINHDENNVKDVDLIIYSAAIKKHNTEYQYAIKNNISTLSRAEALTNLFKNTYNICITGTHGKSTTTALVHKIINDDVPHTLVLGAIDKELQSNYYYSTTNNLLLELDESDDSLNYINPSILLINNIDTDHLSSTKTFNDLLFLFYSAAMKIKNNGYLIVCDDDLNVKLFFDKYPNVNKNIIKYSINSNSDAIVKLILYEYIPNEFSVKIAISYNNVIYDNIILPLIGKFNITNALAAITVALTLNVNIIDVITRIENFKGIDKRLDFKGQYNGRMVIDDYAHHPTEIENVIDTLNEYMSFNKNSNRLLVVIKPMRLSRLNYLFQEHIDIINKYTNIVILPTDQYDENVNEFPLNSYKLYEKLKELNVDKDNIYYAETKEDLKEIIDKNTTNGDILLFLGAGTICEYSSFLVEFPISV